MPEALFATFRVDAMVFGLEVGAVREVLRDQAVEPVPRAAVGVLGMINLRGQVLCVTDVRALMGLPPAAPAQAAFFVVDGPGRQDVLCVDSAGDVIAVQPGTSLPVPQTVVASIAQYLTSAHKLEDCLLLVVDLSRLLSTTDY